MKMAKRTPRSRTGIQGFWIVSRNRPRDRGMVLVVLPRGRLATSGLRKTEHDQIIASELHPGMLCVLSAHDVPGRCLPALAMPNDKGDTELLQVRQSSRKRDGVTQPLFEASVIQKVHR